MSLGKTCATEVIFVRMGAKTAAKWAMIKVFTQHFVDVGSLLGPRHEAVG